MVWGRDWFHSIPANVFKINDLGRSNVDKVKVNIYLRRNKNGSEKKDITLESWEKYKKVFKMKCEGKTVLISYW